MPKIGAYKGLSVTVPPAQDSVLSSWLSRRKDGAQLRWTKKALPSFALSSGDTGWGLCWKGRCTRTEQAGARFLLDMPQLSSASSTYGQGRGVHQGSACFPNRSKLPLFATPLLLRLPCSTFLAYAGNCLSFYSFIHICIRCLSHFSPFSPTLSLSPASLPGRNCSALFYNFVEEKT
jgi:hypothetical protein